MLYFRCQQLVGRVDLCPRADSTHFLLATSGARAFIDRKMGIDVGTAQSTLTVIFKLIISGLTSVILIVLGTVNLQFQGPFVPISLRPVLRVVPAHVWGTVWSSGS